MSLKRSSLPLLLLVFFCLILAGAASAAPPVPLAPIPPQLINDFAGLLQPDDRVEMEKVALALNEASGADLVVVTVDNLGGYPIEDYSLALFRQWGLGDRDKNNGVLLLVNKENVLAGQSSRVRIEVGYGLEGALPDGKAGRILDEYVLPFWSQQKYSEGIYHGFMALAAAIAQEYQIDWKSQDNLAALEGHTQADGGFPLAGLLVIIIIFYLLRRSSTRSRRPRGRSPFDNDHWGGPFIGGGFGGRGGGGFGGGGFGGFGGGSGGGGGASR